MDDNFFVYMVYNLHIVILLVIIYLFIILSSLIYLLWLNVIRLIRIHYCQSWLLQKDVLFVAVARLFCLLYQMQPEGLYA